MLDLDNFKAANDLYGHKMGDRVLCEVSDILRQNFRETDCIARLGGDEFAVFLPELPDKQLVVQRVQSVLKQFPIVLDGETRTEISVSVGIACKNGGEDMSYEQLCDKADIVMYSAKNSGKARAVLAPDTFGKELIVTAEEQEYRNRFRIAQ
jgi:diguanylate cyclase (GGDEF)-like protein